MKRQHLIRMVAERARATGLAWALVRQGRSHEWWRCGSTGVAIPRHREIPELTALAILRELEGRIGQGLVEAMSRMTYTAQCRRSQGWWAIRVPEVPGAFSQARRLSQVQPMVRDVVALALDVAPDSFDVRIEVTLPEPSQRALDRAVELRHEAQLAAASAARATIEALRSMVDGDGLTIREAGQLLGLSHQRVAQLMRTSTPA